MLDTFVEFIVRGLSVVFLFGALILVHEWGHFLVARWCGVRVLRFSIGFGPKIFGWKRGDTEYWLAWVPLGGYVKMAGENPNDVSGDTDEYSAKPVWQRFLIVFAGPLTNFVSALALLWAFFLAGYPGILPVVGEVIDDKPAYHAGFQENDEIVSINGKPTLTWDQMTAAIRKSSGEPLAVEVMRGTERVELRVTPEIETLEIDEGKTIDVGLIGVVAGGIKLGPIPALTKSTEILAHWTDQTLRVLGSLVLGKREFRDAVTGPIGIAHLTARTVDAGIGPILILMALISLSLAIFNCFPIPVLDGGHLLFLIIEAIKGSPVSLAVQEKAAMVGLVMLVSLAVVVSIMDITRFVR